MPYVSAREDMRRTDRPLGPNVNYVSHDMMFWFVDLLNSSPTRSFVLCVMWCADTQELCPCILEAQVTEKMNLPCTRTSWVSPRGFSWLVQCTKLLPPGLKLILTKKEVNHICSWTHSSVCCVPGRSCSVQMYGGMILTNSHAPVLLDIARLGYWAVLL